MKTENEGDQMKQTMTPLQVLDVLKMIVSAHQENHKITEEETTKRENIKASCSVEIEKINAQKEILKVYLEGIFAERKSIIDQMFNALDKGIDSCNLDVITMATNSIISIAKESPLEQVQSLVNNFKDNSVKSIEI